MLFECRCNECDPDLYAEMLEKKADKPFAYEPNRVPEWHVSKIACAMSVICSCKRDQLYLTMNFTPAGKLSTRHLRNSYHQVRTSGTSVSEYLRYHE